MIYFCIPSLYPSFDSSVGRAVDCSWLDMRRASIGRWFESGSKEEYFFKCSFFLSFRPPHQRRGGHIRCGRFRQDRGRAATGGEQLLRLMQGERGAGEGKIYI